MPKNPELTSYRRRLPHWRLDGSTYFVTWRLHPNQRPLLPDERDVVDSAIRHFEKVKYELFAFVVMNDHCHILFMPISDHQLKDIVYSWKSYSAHRMQREFKRVGAIWQDESFDRIVRNEAEFLEKGNYILNNPRKRWPVIEDYPWVGLGRDN